MNHLTPTRRFAALLAATMVLVWSSPAEAAPPSPTRAPARGVVVRVVDQFGEPLTPASAMACPYEGNAVCNPDHLVAASTSTAGIATLRLDPDERYDVTGFVRNPDPGWACPGALFNGSEFYFSAEGNLTGTTPGEIDAGHTLVVHRPSASDCIPIGVIDDLGNALPAAGLFVCPLAGDGTPCPTGQTFDGPDADGVIRMVVDPTVTYRLGAFLADSGWPCPGFVSGDGTTFHFSPNTLILGSDLIADGLTLVIHHPSASECPADNATVHVVDDLGNALPAAGLFVCPLAGDGTPCPTGQTFDGPDADGLIHMTVDPAVTYRLGAYIANSGWPCPGFVSGDGTTFHFSPNTLILGSDLIADGLTLVIHHPSASECP